VALLDEIVQAVKKKRELAALDDGFVREKVERFLAQNKKIRKKVDESKSFKEFSRGADFKELKRAVREELRKVYGVFDKDEKQARGRLLNALKKEPERKELITQLLETHQSSIERIHEYEIVYKRLREYIGDPARVLDLGCGANPYSYLMLSRNAEYLSVDLPSDDLEDIGKFFSITGLQGKTAGIDLVKEYETLANEKGDVALLFKVLDSLEEVKRHISNKVLDSLDVTWLVVSFPTMSLGGKKHIKKERRAWFEKLLARRGWYYETFSISNEVFYVILKKPEQKKKTERLREDD
jgi:16S rRNA (guanine(1405)-N(7))-methyltransferase